MLSVHAILLLGSDEPDTVVDGNMEIESVA